MLLLLWIFLAPCLAAPPVIPLEARGSLPAAKCRFAVRKDGPEGELVKGVALDMQLYYSIDCEAEEGYCLSVTNCTVSADDSKQPPYPIIDENGCSLETSLYENVTYRSPFSAGILNPLPIRFRGSSSAVLLYCVTSLRQLEGDGCPRFQCPPL